MPNHCQLVGNVHKELTTAIRVKAVVRRVRMIIIRPKLALLLVFLVLLENAQQNEAPKVFPLVRSVKDS